MDPGDKDTQRHKLEEIFKRKQEVESRKKTSVETPNKEVNKYEELTRDNTRKKTTKDRVFNNAFCVEIKEEEERVMNIIRESNNKPTAKPELTWYEQVLEKERKFKREETRLAQDRLKMIDKRTRYADIIREVLSPPTRAKNSVEPMPLIRSASKKDTRLEGLGSCKASECSQKSEQVRTLRPRSLSRKELTPRQSVRSLAPRQTSPPIKGNLS